MQPSRSVASPGSTSALRAANRRRVLSLLRGTADTWTQAEIARATALAPATVSTIVRKLAEEGLVDTVPGSGRRGSSVQLSPRAGTVAGVVFGHSHLSVAVGDLTGHRLDEARLEFSSDDHQVALARAREMFHGLATGPGELRTLALGLPAPIQDNVVSSSAIFPGWEGVDSKQAAEEAFGVPAYVENDANLGALAELVWGAGKGKSDLAYIKVSSGVGAGLISAGRIHRGIGGTAGEIGHTLVASDGPVCRCGNRGCLETVASSRAVADLLSASRREEISTRRLLELSAAGDPAAQGLIGDAGRSIGIAVANLCNLLNPEAVVVGGDLSAAGDVLLGPLRYSVRRKAIPSAVEGLQILPGVLGDRAELLGALALVMHQSDRFFTSAIPVGEAA
jgi:predicted NBD/HSP70 family sugar kinase